MRKKIHYVTVHYKWRSFRMQKGIEVVSKKWKEDKHTTCVTEIDPLKLEKNERFCNSLSYIHNAKLGIEIKITDVVVHKFLCMSHDVY
tara:strand:+ start:66 stop:329 length:264 start_codon:yes stop_codon:yes gene_type:complete